ncbi:Golgi-associated plant pathogenesis-related protein 1-like isoform X1 [Anguilla rostrata]|uniref:Golgi-associated plant pathogenesis-related protein 1-like isoform X1 n=1 Tax=Anguilla rostrata TaxID=7938 RepID=UPI0030D5995B
MYSIYRAADLTNSRRRNTQRKGGRITPEAQQTVLQPTIIMASESYKKEFLDAHNAYRAKHQVPSLALNQDLCASAQAWADHLLSIKTLQHSGCKNGENLFYSWSSATQALNGKDPVDKWYNEVKDYDFSDPGFQSNTGHFTQVVWKETKEAGVGVATDGKTVFVVGQYSPAGNMTNEGYFENNVLPAVAGSKGEKEPSAGAPDLSTYTNPLCSLL